jgi:predicted transposase/invertase (TIGR01784 family)
MKFATRASRFGDKFVFGRESTRPILTGVLDSVLAPAPGRHIRDLEFLDPFNDKESLDDKLSNLDIKARDESGRQFNVELQMLADRYYEKRILYYTARLHQQQLQQGQDYLELKPTISIRFSIACCFTTSRGNHWLS